MGFIVSDLACRSILNLFLCMVLGSVLISVFCMVQYLNGEDPLQEDLYRSYTVLDFGGSFKNYRFCFTSSDCSHYLFLLDSVLAGCL